MPLVTHVGGGTNAHYSGSKAVALLQIESGGFTSRRADLVAHLRRRVRTAPRAEARHHRDARELVPATADRARRRLVRSTTRSATSRSTGRCSSRCRGGRASTWPKNVFFGASFASPHEVGAGGAPRARVPAAVGLGLSPPRGHLRVPRGTRHAVGDPARAAQHVLRRAAGRDRADGRRERRSTSTASTPMRTARHRRRDRRPHPRRAGHADRRGARRGRASPRSVPGPAAGAERLMLEDRGAS